MGNVIASCGHRLTRKQAVLINPVLVRALNRDGTRAVSHIVLCPKCLRTALLKHCIISTDDERDRWLDGAKEGMVW